MQSCHVTSVTFHLDTCCFQKQTDAYFRVLALSVLRLASLASRDGSNCVDLLAYGYSKCNHIRKAYSSQLTSHQSSAFIVQLFRKLFFCSKHLLMGMQLEGHQQSCSTEWVLAAALSRVRKLPPMSLKTLGRLTHNPHHRKMVFGPPAVWHHSAFPLLDLCQMPALRTLRGGACCWAAHSDSQYLIFHHTNEKQLKEPGVLHVLLLLFYLLISCDTVTDALLQRTLKTKSCSIPKFPLSQLPKCEAALLLVSC